MPWFGPDMYVWRARGGSIVYFDSVCHSVDVWRSWRCAVAGHGLSMQYTDSRLPKAFMVYQWSVVDSRVLTRAWIASPATQQSDVHQWPKGTWRQNSLHSTATFIFAQNSNDFKVAVADCKTLRFQYLPQSSRNQCFVQCWHPLGKLPQLYSQRLQFSKFSWSVIDHELQWKEKLSRVLKLIATLPPACKVSPWFRWVAYSAPIPLA